jgi:hypothetical protein
MERYVANPEAAHRYQALGKRTEQVLGWITGKSRQALNLAQAKICFHLWENQNQPLSVSNLSPRDTFTRDRLTQATRKIAYPAAEDPGLELGAFLTSSSIWSAYTPYFEKFLSECETPPFIEPDLLEEDAQRNRFPTTLEKLARVRGFCLLSGLPGGGKTQIQVWIARKRKSEDMGYDFFLDLVEYARSGFTNPFDFAAHFLVRSLRMSAGFEAVRSTLIDEEKNRGIFWHVENWDRLHEEAQSRCLSSLSGLSTVLFSTEDADKVTGLAKKQQLDLPQQVYHILPWKDRKKSLFVETYLRKKPGENPMEILTRMDQLPGLASLPAGVGYLCDHYAEAPVELMIGYLSAHQVAYGNLPVEVSIRYSGPQLQVDWGNPVVNEVYEIAGLLLRHGPMNVYNRNRVDPIDPILLASRLQNSGATWEARIRQASEMLLTGCQGGILYRSSTRTYAFAVPEIASLLVSAFAWTAMAGEISLLDLRYASERTSFDPSIVFLDDFGEYMATIGYVDHPDPEPQGKMSPSKFGHPLDAPDIQCV